MRESTNIFRVLIKTLLHAGIGVFSGFVVFLGAARVWEESIAFSRVFSPLLAWLVMFAIAYRSWLTLLPAVLATVPVVSVWDLVAFRLGPSPHTSIPLFETFTLCPSRNSSSF